MRHSTYLLFTRVRAYLSTHSLIPHLRSLFPTSRSFPNHRSGRLPLCISTYPPCPRITHHFYHPYVSYESTYPYIYIPFQLTYTFNSIFGSAPTLTRGSKGCAPASAFVRYAHQRRRGLARSAALPRHLPHPHRSLPNNCVIITCPSAAPPSPTTAPVPVALLRPPRPLKPPCTGPSSPPLPSATAPQSLPPTSLCNRPSEPRPHPTTLGAPLHTTTAQCNRPPLSHIPPALPVSVPLRKSLPAAHTGPIKPLLPHALTPSAGSLVHLPAAASEHPQPPHPFSSQPPPFLPPQPLARLPPMPTITLRCWLGLGFLEAQAGHIGLQAHLTA
ncbi:hypothetical protein DFH08DRAFT_969970 [Mycena albidolilacea]|uniref:Uncharacterized protein n=1 Tax=Mycena albidolilacea TaxID=1033008 RepID=A0AAD6ZH45_9AGAR|nr:hypothetical protein DFH08DRAFT_969970 [Mycena albidolilacea]